MPLGLCNDTVLIFPSWGKNLRAVPSYAMRFSSLTDGVALTPESICIHEE